MGEFKTVIETRDEVENSLNPSSVCIRLCKYRKKVFYTFYKSTFRRKNAKLFVMALTEREILTSREVLYTKFFNLACVISCFAKTRLSKIRIFSTQNVSSSIKKLTQHVL